MIPFNSFANQRVIFFLTNSFKKVGRNVWLICFKALILHPLSREKGNAVEILEQRKGYEQPVNENFLKNISQKVLPVQNKALPLYPLSQRKPRRRVL